MPHIFLSNRVNGTRPGNLLLYTSAGSYEIGITRGGEVEFVAVYRLDNSKCTVYRDKLYPSQFKKWHVEGAADFDDIVFVKVSARELQEKMKEALHQFILDDIDAKLEGNNED